MTTTLSTDHIETIQDLISDIDGADLRSYSGRGMYGKRCLGIDMDSMADAFRFALMVQDEDLSVALSNPCFDSMGLGIIVYFPNVEAPEGIDEDEDE
jgi:hypothetical protein